MTFEDAKYNKFGTIDAMLQHPEFGWIPCTFAENDPHTAALFHAASGIAAPYVEPEE